MRCVATNVNDESVYRQFCRRTLNVGRVLIPTRRRVRIKLAFLNAANVHNAERAGKFALLWKLDRRGRERGRAPRLRRAQPSDLGRPFVPRQSLIRLGAVERIASATLQAPSSATARNSLVPRAAAPERLLRNAGAPHLGLILASELRGDFGLQAASRRKPIGRQRPHRHGDLSI